jgi:hypothetical protein
MRRIFSKSFQKLAQTEPTWKTDSPDLAAKLRDNFSITNLTNREIQEAQSILDEVSGKKFEDRNMLKSIINNTIRQAGLAYDQSYLNVILRDLSLFLNRPIENQSQAKETKYLQLMNPKNMQAYNQTIKITVEKYPETLPKFAIFMKIKTNPRIQTKPSKYKS